MWGSGLWELRTLEFRPPLHRQHSHEPAASTHPLCVGKQLLELRTAGACVAIERLTHSRAVFFSMCIMTVCMHDYNRLIYRPDVCSSVPSCIALDRARAKPLMSERMSLPTVPQQHARACGGRPGGIMIRVSRSTTVVAAGVMLLETAESAEARGQEPLAELLGFGASGDAFHISQPAPQGAGAALAMRRALRDGGLSAAHVTHVNAHASSTGVGDRLELEALQEVLFHVPARPSTRLRPCMCTQGHHCVLLRLGRDVAVSITPVGLFPTPAPRLVGVVPERCGRGVRVAHACVMQAGSVDHMPTSPIPHAQPQCCPPYKRPA